MQKLENTAAAFGLDPWVNCWVSVISNIGRHITFSTIAAYDDLIAGTRNFSTKLSTLCPQRLYRNHRSGFNVNERYHQMAVSLAGNGAQDDVPYFNGVSFRLLMGGTEAALDSTRVLRFAPAFGVNGSIQLEQVFFAAWILVTDQGDTAVQELFDPGNGLVHTELRRFIFFGPLNITSSAGSDAYDIIFYLPGWRNGLAASVKSYAGIFSWVNNGDAIQMNGFGGAATAEQLPLTIKGERLI